MRVGFVLRSAEIKPLFLDLCSRACAHTPTHTYSVCVSARALGAGDHLFSPLPVVALDSATVLREGEFFHQVEIYPNISSVTGALLSVQVVVEYNGNDVEMTLIYSERAQQELYPASMLLQ